MYDAAVVAATRVVLRNPANKVVALGITNQRASVVAWDARTGLPLGPGIGWQDLRTVMECIAAKSEHGLAIAPNQTATKAAWLRANTAAGIPDTALRFGTIDSWLTWKLSSGEAFITDHTNAAVTGLVDVATVDWDPAVCAIFDIPLGCLPRVTTSRGVAGTVNKHGVLDGIPLAARIGDQQASLVGQGCINPGRTKITFGTGGMLNAYTGLVGPTEARRTPHGTFPIVAFSLDDSSPAVHWGLEAIMLSAGTNVEWLHDDMALIESAADSEAIAASVTTTDGVAYIPALLGLGTPDWDYGARGTLLGLTRGTTRAHVVRAVLEGVAHRGADLLEAIEADHPAVRVPEIRVDGGMSRNRTFVQALADATGRPVAVSPISEATTLGAGYLAGLATGTWASLDEIAGLWRPLSIVEPRSEIDRARQRAKWADAVTRASGWIPELSSLDF